MMTPEEQMNRAVDWNWHYKDLDARVLVCTKGHTVTYMSPSKDRDAYWLLCWPDSDAVKVFEGPQPAMNYAMEHPDGPPDLLEELSGLSGLLDHS